MLGLVALTFEGRFPCVPADGERVVGIRGQEANALASPGPIALPGPWVHSHGKPPLDAIWVREPILGVTSVGNAGWWCLSLPFKVAHGQYCIHAQEL